MQYILKFLFKILFRFRIYNQASVNRPGPLLLVPNHVSWFDWLLIAVCLDEDWKFVTATATARYSWLHRLVTANKRTFPIDPASPYAVKHMAEFLRNGGRLVLFAEGRISRTGSLMKLFEGVGFLLHKTGTPVVTAYLRGAKRLMLVRHKGWRRVFPEVTIHFSRIHTPPELGPLPTSKARTKLTNWLQRSMVEQQFNVEMEFIDNNTLNAVRHTAKYLPKKTVLEDITGQTLTYRRLLLSVDLMSSAITEYIPAGERHIGVLLPNLSATPITVMSLWALRKVPAILNFSLGIRSMSDCAQLAGLKFVITSRSFLERSGLSVDAMAKTGIEFLYLEDIRRGISGYQKLMTALGLKRGAKLKPNEDRDETAVILFTSGSEGAPKGVKLSHKNILSNIQQLLPMIDVQDDERMFNALPVFHSFGFTLGTFVPLVRGLYVFMYPSPLHYKMVPLHLYDKSSTIFLATNTFLNGYARKAHPYDFRTLRFLFAGAEKLQESTARTWASKFGVRILEGYGVTECSPTISVNTPLQPRFGSAGQLLPGIEFKIEPEEGISDGGRLLVRGANVMQGYLNPGADHKFKTLGGWYDTGDVARVDDDGFLYIIGRLKRFAKISGEMISLALVEKTLSRAFSEFGGKFEIAVLNVPDKRKGEMLVAFTNEPRLSIDEIRHAIKERGLSNLCFPRQLVLLKTIPKLGTGKFDYRRLQDILSQQNNTQNK
ncbi:MAG: AMP-binding protein [Verrucomicrobia bacterium]|nr:AMP-binding protein [Verrucomicrobiota bacterium]